jgi:exonuclease VII small subunit
MTAIRTARARLALAEQRLAQLDAEAAELKRIINASCSHVREAR